MPPAKQRARDEYEDGPPPIPIQIGNWWLNENLGSGYSGSIYRATNLHTHQVVALKVQWVHHECPTNKYERHIYPLLQGGKGMPNLYDSGVDRSNTWDYLAIELLGSSLDSLFRKSGKETMDLRSVCSIAIQVIKGLETMHQRGVLHRDIQLGNCVIGLPPKQKNIYMIDFGFSKRYIDPYTGRHIQDSKLPRDFIGNYWFSSVNVHCRGKVPSRRDDLEAAALMFIHLLTPRGLSWTRNGVPKTDEAHNRLKAEKRKATAAHLCRGLPAEFEDFLTYTRSLAFKELPDYERWARAFEELAIEEGFTNVEEFIWPPPPVPVKPVTINTPLRARTPAVPREEMADIINDLTRLNLGAAKNILGDRTNVQEAVRKAKEDAAKRKPQRPGVTSADLSEVIVISSDSEDGGRGEAGDRVPGQVQPFQATRSKAFLLNRLADKASNAPDNATLAALVKEYTLVLQMNSSRTLTKEASYFLDVLHKQLDDPSVFVKPQRASRQTSLNAAPVEKEPAHVKLGVVARLRMEVQHSRTNKTLAVLVSDFAKVTNRSVGRTITKDGFAFLDGLSDRLQQLK